MVTDVNEAMAGDASEDPPQEGRIDPEYVTLWFRQAAADADEALHSKSPLHGLFWVQQSVEKSVKGLMLLSGKSYSNIRRLGHHSLKGDLRIIGDILDLPVLGRMVDRFVDSDPRRKLRELRSQLSTTGVAELRLLNVGALDYFLAIVPNIEKARENVLKTSLKDVRVRLWSDTSPSAQMEALKDLESHNSDVDIADIVESIISTHHLCEHHLAHADIACNPRLQNEIFNEVERVFQRTEAELSLYLLAAVTFPHVGSTRYPARPCAPPGPREATEEEAKKNNDSFGVQHYSQEIGVVRRMKRLARAAAKVARVLQVPLPLIEAAANLPPCQICETAETLAGC